MSPLRPSSSYSNSHTGLHQPQPLPSLPPTPTEEDLAGAALWHEVSEEEALRDTHIWGDAPGNGNGKGKERAEISLDESDGEVDVDIDGETTPTLALDGGYPPLKDEEEESRKVEENLRRLEEAERQRRKAARDNAASGAPGSVVSGVSRRASLLLSSSLTRSGSSGGRSRGRGNRSSSGGSGSGGGGGGGGRPAAHHVHSQLGQSSDDALPLDDLHASPNTLMSPAGSSPPSPNPDSNTITNKRGTGVMPVPTIVENPFEPPDSATPLHGFPPQNQEEDGTELSGSTVMRPSSPPLSTPTDDHLSQVSPFDDRLAVRPAPGPSPGLANSQAFSRPHHPAPPPLPLDLPPPKTPPPRVDTPGGTPIVASPPKRVSAPSTSRHADGREADRVDEQEQEDVVEHRWWTDWLCGCREEKDRDNAGRTNPFE